MKICMIGAGSLGSAIGGTLALGGHDVTLIDPYEAHIEAIRKNGLRMATGPEGGEQVAEVRAATGCQGLSAQDLVIFLVKSFATKEAVRAAKQAGILGEDTLALTLQNGLGNEETMAEELGCASVISGKTFVSGQMLEPGKVMASVKGHKTLIGEMDGAKSARVERLAVEFTHSGLDTVVSDNIRGMIWDKLFVNVATGAISGITGLPYGGLYGKYGHNVEPGLRNVALAAITEAVAVAKASGVQIPCEDVEAIWNSAAEGQPESFKASILQSLERNSQSEIDFINGAVSREGRKVGIPTPVNDTLTACMKGIEYRMGFGSAIQ